MEERFQFKRWQVFLGSWALFIPLNAIFSAYHPFSERGIYYAVISAAILALANAAFFRKGAGLLRLLAPSLVLFVLLAIPHIGDIADALRSGA